MTAIAETEIEKRRKRTKNKQLTTETDSKIYIRTECEEQNDLRLEDLHICYGAITTKCMCLCTCFIYDIFE